MRSINSVVISGTILEEMHFINHPEENYKAIEFFISVKEQYKESITEQIIRVIAYDSEQNRQTIIPNYRIVITGRIKYFNYIPYIKAHSVFNDL